MNIQKPNKKLEDLQNRNDHIKRIIVSLRKEYNKKTKDTLLVSKKQLIYKIVDELGVALSIAYKYINIIESRGIIRIEKDILYYNPEKDIPAEDNIKDIDKILDDKFKEKPIEKEKIEEDKK